MANAAGGSILFGIGEKGGCADALIGVDVNTIDADILRLTSILRSGIEPRSLRFAFEQIQVNGSTVLELRVPQSFSRPHWVIAGGDLRFYVRNNAGKNPMSLDEIREAFIYDAAIIDRALTWRTERTDAIYKDSSLDHAKIWAVLHLVPLRAFSASAPKFDPQSQFRSGEFQLRTPFDAGSGNPNYLGWRYESRDHDGNVLAYLQIYRDFRMELVFEGGDRSEKQNVTRLWAGVLETDLGKWLTRFKAWTGEFEYPLPAFALLSLLNTRASVIISDHRTYQTNEATLHLEPALIEDGQFEPRSALLPAYNHLYQSYGFAACPYFDAQGKWRSDVRL